MSTANDVGSSRRHSSQSIVWIPPTLGGKSLVTNRWVIGGRRIARRGPTGSVSCSIGGRRSSRPSRRAAQTAWLRSSGSAWREVAIAAGRATTGSSAVADVAEHDQRVAPHVPDVAPRDVPAVRRARAPRRRPGRAGSTRSAQGSSSPDGGPHRCPPVRRAHLLALVAPVDAIAERDAVLDRERPLRLEQPGEAAPRVDHARRGDRAGGTPVEAAVARPAAVLDRARGGRHRRIGDDAPEHVPAPEAGEEQVGVLAPPPDAGAVRRGAIDHGVVVGEDPGPPAVRLEHGRHRLQPGLEVGVVVLPRVPGDASGVRRALAGGGVVDEVAPCAHDQGGGVREGDLRIGGAGGLAVGEGHARRAARPPCAPRGCAGRRRTARRWPPPPRRGRRRARRSELLRPWHRTWDPDPPRPGQLRWRASGRVRGSWPGRSAGRAAASSMRSASPSSCLVRRSSTDSASASSTARWKLPERAPRRALRIRPF